MTPIVLPAGIDRSLMRGSVDSFGEAADDDGSATNEPRGEATSVVETVL